MRIITLRLEPGSQLKQRNRYSCKYPIRTGSTVVVQCKDGGPCMPHITGDYLKNEVMNGNKNQTENKNKLSELTDKFNNLNNNEQRNKIEMERKDIEPNMIHPGENMHTQQNEDPKQSTTNKLVDKQDSRSKCKSKRPHHDKIRTDQQKTG